MHLKRLIVAAILIPLFYLYIMRLPHQYFFFLAVLISAGGLLEFYGMTRLAPLLKISGIVCGTALLGSFYSARHLVPEVLLLSVLVVGSIRLFMKRDASGSTADTAYTIFGMIYVPGLLSFQFPLARANPAWIILLFASVWASDSAAYYVGKGLGRRKLYVEISPNKTMEGAAGSVLGGMLGAEVIRFFLMKELSPVHAAVLGFAVGVSTIIGDLVESMFKRDVGVKDSGSLLPGHGGVLDKIDGVTFAGPVFYWICAGLGLI